MPPYVLDVRGDMILLDGSVDSISTKLGASPYAADLCHDDLGHLCLRFPIDPIEWHRNIPLMERLFFLQQVGVLFGEDYKLLCSPAEFMRELQYSRVFREPFDSLYRALGGRWGVRTNQPQ